MSPIHKPEYVKSLVASCSVFGLVHDPPSPGRVAPLRANRVGDVSVRT